jgi:hypothetical protein
MDRLGRRIEPVPDGDVAGGQNGVEDLGMSKHLPSRRSFVRQDQKSRGCGSCPAEPFLGNPMGQADLFVVTPESLLDRRQFGLDLDHQG